jgi:hypothetical protein
MTAQSFFDIWTRITGETPIKNFTQLADVVESSKQSVSRKKNEKEFPVDWAFKVSQKFNINTDWIMTGEGPKRLEDNTTAPDREETTKGIIEEWVKYVREKEGNDGRIVMELSLQVQEFREWYKEKKSKSGGAETGLPHENVA